MALWMAAPPRAAWDVAAMVGWIAWAVHREGWRRREAPVGSSGQGVFLRNRSRERAWAAGWFGVALELGVLIAARRGEEGAGVLELIFALLGVALLGYWYRLRRQERRYGEIRFWMGSAEGVRLGGAVGGRIEGSGIPEGPWRWRLQCWVSEDDDGDLREEGPIVEWEQEWVTAGREWEGGLPEKGKASGKGVKWELVAKSGGVEGIFVVPVLDGPGAIKARLFSRGRRRAT